MHKAVLININGICRACRVTIPKGSLAQKRTAGKKGQRKGYYCSTDCVTKRPWSVYFKNKRFGTRDRLKKLASSRAHEDFYRSGAWQVARYEALKKSKVCMACGMGPPHGKRLHVDHIKPRHLYPHLELEISNLQILCEDCNLGKGAWDETDWRPRLNPQPMASDLLLEKEKKREKKENLKPVSSFVSSSQLESLILGGLRT